MQISLYGFGGFLISLRSATTSDGVKITLFSSSVFCPLVPLTISLFLSLSMPVSLLFCFFSSLGGLPPCW